MEFRPEDITPGLLDWLTEGDRLIAEKGEEMRAKYGDQYDQMEAELRAAQAERQRQYLNAREAITKALYDSNDAEAYRATVLNVTDGLRPDVAERLGEDLKIDGLGYKAYKNLRDRFSLRYGSPERALQEYEARGESMSAPAAQALGGMADFKAFLREFNQSLASEQRKRPGEKPEDMADRVAETMTNFGIGLDYIMSDPSASVELGVELQDRFNQHVSMVLKNHPELAPLSDNPQFQQYVAARNTYLAAAFQTEQLAQDLLDSGQVGTYREAKERVREMLTLAHGKLVQMKDGLDTSVKNAKPKQDFKPVGRPNLDFVGAVGPETDFDIDVLPVPPSPEEIPMDRGLWAPGGENTMNSVIRGVMRIPEAFNPELAAMNALRYPTQDSPNRRYGGIIPANWETTMADFGEFGIAMGPQFGGAELVAGRAVAKMAGGAALKAAVRGGLTVGLGEAVTPRPGDAGEYAKRVGGAAAAGAVGGAVIGKGVEVLGKAFAKRAAEKAALAAERDLPASREALNRTMPGATVEGMPRDVVVDPKTGKRVDAPAPARRMSSIERTPDEVAALESKIVEKIGRTEAMAGESLDDATRSSIRQFVQDSARAGETDEQIMADATQLIRDAVVERVRGTTERARVEGTVREPVRSPTKPEPKLGPKAKKLRQENAARRKARLESRRAIEGQRRQAKADMEKATSDAERKAIQKRLELQEKAYRRYEKKAAENRAASDAERAAAEKADADRAKAIRSRAEKLVEREEPDVPEGADPVVSREARFEADTRRRVKVAEVGRRINRMEAEAEKIVRDEAEAFGESVPAWEREAISEFIDDGIKSGMSDEGIISGVRRLATGAVRRARKLSDRGLEPEPPKAKLKSKKKGGAANPKMAEGVEGMPVEGTPLRVKFPQVEGARKGGGGSNVRPSALRTDDPSFRPKSPTEMLAAAQDLFSGKIGFTRGKFRKYKGFYDPKTGQTALSEPSDIPTSIHELAHSMGVSPEQVRWLSGFEDELFQHRYLGTVWGPRASSRRMVKQGGKGLVSRANEAADSDHILKEAFAEWVKDYFLDPDVARARAPRLWKAFNKKQGEKWVAAAGQLSEDIRLHAGSVHAMGSNIMPLGSHAKGSPTGVRLPWWSRYMEHFHDEVRPATVDFVEMALGGKRSLTDRLLPSENPDMLYSGLAGTRSYVAQQIDHGITDSLRRRIMDGGKPITVKRMVDAVLGRDSQTVSSKRAHVAMRDLWAFMLSQRTLERSKPGKVFSGSTAGMGDEMQRSLKYILKLKQQDPEKYARLEEGARIYRLISSNIVRKLRDAGLISNALFKEIREANAYYLAMNRFSETSPGELALGRGLMRGDVGNIANAQMELWELHQSGLPIRDPLASLLKSIQKNESAIAANEILLAMRTLALGRSSVQRDLGLGTDHLARLAYQTEKGKPFTTVIWVDGKPEYWHFAEPFHVALTGIYQEGGLGPAWRQYSRAVRWTVTHVPAFPIKNQLRDTQGRLIRTTARWGPFGIFPRGIGKTFRHTPERIKNDHALWGGEYAGWYFNSPFDYERAAATALDEIIGRGDSVIIGANPANVAKRGETLLRWSESRTRRVEFWTVYEDAIKRGLSHKDAAILANHESRMLMDWARVGRSMKAVAQVLPFVRARSAAIRSLGRAAQRNPGGIVAFMFLAGLTEHMAKQAWLKVHGEKAKEMYDGLQWWEKDMFYNIPVFAGPVRWIRIPKEYDYAFFSGIIEREFARAAGDKEAASANSYFDSFARTIAPFDARELGLMFIPVTEAMSNYDMFLGRNIVPQHENERMPAERDWEGDASPAMEAAYDWLMRFDWMAENKHFLDDPRKADHILKSILTSYYQSFVDVQNWAAGRKPAAGLLKHTGTLSSSPKYPQAYTDALELSTSLGEKYRNSRGMRMLKEFSREGREIMDQEEREKHYLELKRLSEEQLEWLREVRDEKREERKLERSR